MPWDQTLNDMNPSDRIYIAGHRGLVGSALVRRLERAGYKNLVFRSHAEMNLEDQAVVFNFFESEKPDYAFLAAAVVGGIHANNTYPADFIRSNLSIQSNVLEAAYRSRVKKLMFLGSSCIYPRMAPQPMKEEHLLSGHLEPTNIAYATAKIAGIIAAQAYNRQYGTRFISVMPTNLYGPHDNYDLQNSHVLPALIRKFHEAKVAGAPAVTLWGTGRPRREFMHSDDMADACLHLMQTYDSSEIVNIGWGKDVSIAELADMIKAVVGYQGRIVYDDSKPDGPPRKLLDVGRLRASGWTAKIDLPEGLRSAYDWFAANAATARGMTPKPVKAGA